MVSDGDVTFRLRGVPVDFNKDDVRDALRAEFHLGREEHVNIASLASDPFSGFGQTATLRFSKIPDILVSHREYMIRLKPMGDTRSSTPQLDMLLDKHFEHFTPLHCGSGDDPTIDVIAISGLNGHAFGSFKSSSGPYMWLRDSLPLSLPNARVFCWGYGTRGQSFQSIRDLSQRLRGELRILRGGLKVNPPPRLVFVAHSLGGIIVKSTIASMAESSNPLDEANFKSLGGVLFFGVPHQGMNIESLIPMLPQTTQRTLLIPLDHVNSALLASIEEHYERRVNTLPNFKCLNCYETRCSPTAVQVDGAWQIAGPAVILVTPASATAGRMYDADRHEAVQIDRAHRDLVKFTSHYEGAYMRVIEFLSGIVEQTVDTKRIRGFSAVQEECLKSLSFLEQDWREQNNEINAAHGTCGWLLKHQKFRYWLNQPCGLLWIVGHPGAGKSTVMNFATRWMRRDATTKDIVAAAFVHGRGSEIQQTIAGVYRSLLHQLLQHLPEQLESVTAKFRERKNLRQAWIWTEQELLNIFRSTVSEGCQKRSITLLIDALDELGRKSAITLIRQFDSLAASNNHGRSRLRICFSCRHYPNLSPNQALSIKLEEENGEDIENVIAIHDALLELNEPHRREVTDLISQRANGVFQWVILVLDQIKVALDDGGPIAAVKEIIEKVPGSLEGLYDHLLIHSNDNHGQTLKLFQWLLSPIRPLSITELREALAMDSDMTYKTRSEIEHTRNFYLMENMGKVIRSLSKGLAEIKRRDNTALGLYCYNHHRSWQHYSLTVEFIHQSVPDYLSQKGLAALKEKLHLSPETPSYNCHFQLSRSCIAYLSLEDVSKDYSECKRHLERELEKLDKRGYYSGFFHPHETFFCQKWPLSEYAHLFWIYHVMKAELDSVDQKDLPQRFSWTSDRDGIPSIFAPRRFFRPTLHMDDTHEPGYLKLIMKKTPQPREWIWERKWDAYESGHGFRNLFIEAWSGMESRRSLASFLCLAGIGSAVKQMRRLEPNLYHGPDSKSLLIDTLFGGHEGILQAMLEELGEHHFAASAEPDGPFHGVSPLALAILRGREDLVQSFLAAGAQVNSSNRLAGHGGEFRVFGLFLAASEGHADIVQQLLDAGADWKQLSMIYSGSDTQIAPLHIAAVKGHLSVVKALLGQPADQEERYARANVMDSDGTTALQYVAINEEMMFLLSKFGVGLRDEEMLFLLLESGADLNLLHRSRSRPIFNLGQLYSEFDDDDDDDINVGTISDEESTRTSMEVFLDHGADPDQETRYGRTTLSEEKDLEKTSELLLRDEAREGVDDENKGSDAAPNNTKGRAKRLKRMDFQGWLAACPSWFVRSTRGYGHGQHQEQLGEGISTTSCIQLENP